MDNDTRPYKSDIRDSDINKLLEKSANLNYGKYLSKVILQKLRNFEDDIVSFDFPVTALIGPNGGGKTTVMGAAACAYKDVAPKLYFAKSGIFDGSMQDWSIEYEIVDRDLSKKDVVRRTASFRNYRWRRGAVNRDVKIFGVARTLPAIERSELLRCASSSFTVSSDKISEFPETVQKHVARVLGKDVSGFKSVSVDEKRDEILLSGMSSDGDTYSEFHFGAGESSIIRMILEIERGPDQSLILIEEIENGLHPVATIRLVEYLIDVALRKNVQVIFTTHSNDALEPLPSKAIWVSTQDAIFQGKLDVSSLRAVTGQVAREAVIFVEDKFAKFWTEATIRQQLPAKIDHAEVHAMQGDGTAVAMNKYHNDNPATKVPSICYIDGDSLQKENSKNGVFRLPGESPESYVFDKILDAWDFVGGQLTVSLLKDYNETDTVKELCKDVRRKNMDPHLLFSQLGEALGLVPENTVAHAFLNIWARYYKNEASEIIEPVARLVDNVDDIRAKRAKSQTSEDILNELMS